MPEPFIYSSIYVTINAVQKYVSFLIKLLDFCKGRGIHIYKIFIIEDNQVIAKSISQHMESWGYTAYCAGDFQNIITEFVSFEPHLVLLDISLPFYNGYHWCGEIRKISKVPVIFISSAADNMNIVMAVNMGGDDFIAKPFDLNVLTAKVQAVLRRSYNFVPQGHLMEHKGAVLDTTSASLLYKDKKIELTRNEYKILQLLMENRTKAVSRDAIMVRLWESDSYVDENTLSVNMARLRKKLDEAGLKDFIFTKKGIGYIIE